MHPVGSPATHCAPSSQHAADTWSSRAQNGCVTRIFACTHHSIKRGGTPDEKEREEEVKEMKEMEMKMEMETKMENEKNKKWEGGE